LNVEILVLGRFAVRVDGREVPAWQRRQAATLVQVLALAPGRQLHREQVMDALWPDVAVTDAGPRLHKAAFFARRVLGPHSVVLRNDTVALFPDAAVTVDAVRFEELARSALSAATPAALDEALRVYGGTLLPEERYADWAAAARDRCHLLRLRLLRAAGRWSDLAELEPTDEEAQLAAMRQHAARGDRRAALRHFERLDRALHRELGVGPSDEAVGLRDALVAALSQPAPARPRTELVGRDPQTATLDRLLGEASRGRAHTVFVSGAPGVGKSSLTGWLREHALALGWRTGAGLAAAVEGAWPYAPALEALSDLTRRHPTLLDGLDDRYRLEIDRALSGRDLGWSGDGGQQRLFVAVTELVRLAAAGPGALLIVDDVHEADEASLRLLHYLARSCATDRLMLVLAHRRQPVTAAFEEVRASLLGRIGAIDLPLPPLDRDATARLVHAQRPDLDPGPDLVEQLWEVSGGLPFAAVELARTLRPGDTTLTVGAAPLGMLPPATRTVLEQVAVAGTTFDTDEFLALSGLPEAAAFDSLDGALAALVVERTGAGYRFRHPLIREALLAGVAAHRQRQLHHLCAQRLVALDASPARIGHHLLQAGELGAAAPYVLRAAQTEAAIGAYRDALRLVDSVLPRIDGAIRAPLAALRADLLGAVGEPAAVEAYQLAIDLADDAGGRLLRGRLARLAVLSGDLLTAEAALRGLEPDGGPADAMILLARGTLAYFNGDLDTAARATDTTRQLLTQSHDWQVLDLLALQAMLAHHRGEFLQVMRRELQRTRHDAGMATAVFDAHLCVAEYLLYGPTPYREVMAFAADLRATARRAGALRAAAFAATLLGEAALLSGDLGTAELELRDAADLHREIVAPVGEAHSLQRLAEVRLALGDPAGANRLLQRALPLARWSSLSQHLLQRLYGTMVRAATGPQEALAVVERATAGQGMRDRCLYCEVMFTVPATIACADAGDLAQARRFLADSERSAALWEGTAWQAGLLEARAHLARAEHDPGAADLQLDRAAQLFDDAGQPLDAARCRRSRTDVTAAPAT
jgi:DNA-binding SARP family transcriptional activator/tetratricopeptide (TPR) repeat protein